MLRKVKSYFRRRKCYLLSLAVCLVMLLVFAFNTHLDNTDMDGSVLDTLNHRVDRRSVDMTPMTLGDLKINVHNQDFNNDNNINHHNNIENNHAVGVNSFKRHKESMFVRVKDQRHDKGDDNNDDSIGTKKDGDKDIKHDNIINIDDKNSKEEIDDNDNDDENENNQEKDLIFHNEINENKNENIIDTNNDNNGNEVEQSQQIMEDLKQPDVGRQPDEAEHLENINKQGAAVPQQHKPTVLQTHKWFGNLSESGQRAHEAVMTALQQDKQSTFEVNLPSLVFTEAVDYPPFVEFGKRGDPGEGGKAVKETIRKDMKKEDRDAEYKVNQFNLYVSNQVPLHRSLQDMRRHECKSINYDPSTFPSVSVVLVFHDEAWTTLLRSVHSIIDRTPKEALLEILLLDDNSDQPFLGRPLEQYLQPLKVVRLIRSTQRLGLIKARNLGFLYAKGEIVIFLDSHIECFPGWLEPLVVPIMKDPRTVTFPVIPNISKDDFGINRPTTSTVGGLRIHAMSFKWVNGGPEGHQYYKSPTMPGGLYAISRQWFHHLGAYDPELLFWGGENLEISFKIWMCGGNIQAAACSLVGHVFRRDSPFHFDGFTKAIQRNLLRVADIWMDEFKHFYLEKFTYIFNPFGDTSLQRQLRDNLQCHSFRWYIDNVHQRLIKEIDPDGKYSGNIRNVGHDQCLITKDGKAFSQPPSLLGCSMMHYKEVWQYRSDGYLTMYDKMMKVVPGKPTQDGSATYSLSMEEIQADSLASFAVFKYEENQRFVHTNTGLCLDVDVTSDPNDKKVVLATCGNSSNQKWVLQTRQELQNYHKERGVTGIVW